MSEDAAVYDFGPFRIDTALYRLLRNGEAVEIENKVYELLLLLVTNRHRVVGRDEIRKHLWGHEFTSESAIAQCVMKLRRALEAEGEAGEVIENIRGIGYRFAWRVAEQRSGDHGEGKHQSVSLVPPYQERLLPRLWPLSFIALLGIFILVIVTWPSRLPEQAGVAEPAAAPPPTSAAMLVILPIQISGGGDLLSWMRYGGVSLIREVVTRVSRLDVLDTAAAVGLNTDGAAGDDELLRLAAQLGADRVVAPVLWREGKAYVLQARLLAPDRNTMTMTVRSANSYDALIELALNIAASSEGLSLDVTAAGVDRLAVDERMRYISALYAVNAHRWRRAEGELTALFEMRPDFMPGQLLYAETELALGNAEAARAAAERVAATDSPPYRVYATALAAEALTWLGRADEAESMLVDRERHGTPVPDDAAYLQLAWASLHAARGASEAAIASLNAAREHFRRSNRLPDIAETYLREGDLHLERGEYLQAEELSGRALTLAAALGDRILDGRSRLLRARTLLAQGRLSAAAADFAGAAQVLADIDEPAVHLCLLAGQGSAALAAGDLTAAARRAADTAPWVEQVRAATLPYWQVGGRPFACLGLDAVVKFYTGVAGNAWVAMSRLLSPAAAPSEPGLMEVRLYQIHLAAQPGIDVPPDTAAAWAGQLAWPAVSVELRHRIALARAELAYGGGSGGEEAAGILRAAVDEGTPASRVKAHLIANLIWLLSTQGDLDTPASLLAALNGTPLADYCPVVIARARLLAAGGEPETAAALLDRCPGMWQSGLFRFIGEWRAHLRQNPTAAPPTLPYLLPYY